MRGILFLLLACTIALLPCAAPAQTVQRCIGPDGRAVFTDRRCDDVGAVQRLPPPTVGEGARAFRGGCPRLLSQLVGEIGTAIRSGDVNRLSSVYDWRGVPGSSATRLFDRLEAMVERPLVDIAPVYRDYQPSPSPDPEAERTTSPAPSRPSASPGQAAWMRGWGSTRPATAPRPTELPGSATPAQAPPNRSYPVALRIEQTAANSATPVRTVFDLHRAYGCFWISL